jgi:hypothetical protein
MQLLGKVKRDNTRFSSEEANMAGDLGVSVRQSPGWLSQGRPFTIGNTIFAPSKMHENLKDWDIDRIVKEELPHIAQYRDEGLFGFAVKHAKDLFKHGGGEKVYDEKGTHEYEAHWSKPDQLRNQLKPAEGILNYAKSMFSGKPIDKLASTGKIDDVG